MIGTIKQVMAWLLKQDDKKLYEVKEINELWNEA